MLTCKVTSYKWTCQTSVALAVVHAVGQSHGAVGVYESDVEDGFHGGFVEAGEGSPGISRLHLSRGQNSGNSR